VRLTPSVLILALCALSPAQEVLTLNDALKLAKERNGAVRTAQTQLEAAKLREKQAKGAYLPTVTPSLTWSDQKQELLTGANNFFGNAGVQSQTTTQIEARWQLLDSGQRDLSFRSARRGVEAETADATDTLRQTLFSVFQQFIEASRARELVKVQDAQVERSRKVTKQIEAQIKVGDAAAKDVFQPKADELNAVVNQLSARTRQVSNEASLKATIGWEREKSLPSLEELGAPTELREPEGLETLLAEGLEKRPSLVAQRRRLDSTKLLAERTRRTNGLTWSLDASYTKQFGPDNTNNRLLRFTASYPLFDGDISKSAIREAKEGVKGAEATLVQAERSVVAEIESAWREVKLNAERLGAARAAREAAQINFDRVLKSNELGAANVTVVDISQAQLTLVTAESNLIEAIYDYYLSDVRLRLAVGRPIPGE
jgi:outer membrane protein